MLKRLHFEDRKSWLDGRRNSLGASDAAAVVGLSPWTTPLALWKQKLGVEAAPDLSGNEAVQQGVKMEPVLRQYYASTHPQYGLEYYPFDILYQDARPFMTATLDGELIELESGRLGVLEIKNVNISSKTALEKWTGGKMPDYYFVQAIAQLSATGYSFHRLFAALHFLNGDVTLKEFEIERQDVLDDISWLEEQESSFWEKNIRGGVMPSMPLVL